MSAAERNDKSHQSEVLHSLQFSYLYAFCSLWSDRRQVVSKFPTHSAHFSLAHAVNAKCLLSTIFCNLTIIIYCCLLYYFRDAAIRCELKLPLKTAVLVERSNKGLNGR